MHVHHYDLSTTIIKTKNDEDKELLIQKTLQCFLEIMLQADPHTLIQPYIKVERCDKNILDLGRDQSTAYMNEYTNLSRYFTHLSSRNKATGKVYTSLILAQNRPFKDLMEYALYSLCNQNMRIYPKEIIHENTSGVGWLLYLTHQQDE
jgi:hypothetical protein